MEALKSPLASGPLSEAFRLRGCDTIGQAASYLEALPYGRPSNASFEAVLLDGRGTCSSKHALFVELCRETAHNAKLIIGFFPMCEDTVPGVGPILEKAGLVEIWEAHCFAQLPEGRIDLTGLRAGSRPVLTTEHLEIEPAQLARKSDLHKAALARWADQQGIALTLDDLWSVRERCIAALGGVVRITN